MLRVVGARAFPFYVVATALYVIFRIGSFTNIADRVTDTPSYERVASHPMWSLSFYTGERGFTIPLFYKIFATSEARIVAQLVVSVVAWLVLAACVARCVRNEWVRGAAFAVVLAFSLTTEVILWDTLLLSESVTYSLTALLLAAWITVARNPRTQWVVVVLVLSLLWAFARDSNEYAVLFTGIFVAITLVHPGQRRLKTALVVGCLAIFLLAYVSADAGKRWRLPLVDVIAHRVLPAPSLRTYFVAHGLPIDTNWVVSPWIASSGRNVYAEYLLLHPVYTLTAPLHGHQQALYSTSSNPASLIDPNLKIYNDNASRRFMQLPRSAEHVLFPRGVGLMFALTALVLAFALVTFLLVGGEVVWLVPLGALLTTYPNLIVVWHLSGLEVDRHALGVSSLLRLSIIILAAFTLDRAVGAVNDAVAKKAPADVGEPVAQASSESNLT